MHFVTCEKGRRISYEEIATMSSYGFCFSFRGCHLSFTSHCNNGFGLDSVVFPGLFIPLFFRMQKRQCGDFVSSFKPSRTPGIICLDEHGVLFLPNCLVQGPEVRLVSRRCGPGLGWIDLCFISSFAIAPLLLYCIECILLWVRCNCSTY